MNISIIVTAVLSLAIFNTTNHYSNCDGGVFIEENGIIIIEAEDVPLSDGWELQNEVADYSGEGYITWLKETNVEKNNQGLISYPIKITNAGNYTVKIRNYHPCEDFTECNDIFVKMNDLEWQKNFNHTLAEWDWNSRQDIDHVFSDATYELDEGTHTLYLSGRSQDFSIDKIAIFKEGVTEAVYQSAMVSKCMSEK